MPFHKPIGPKPTLLPLEAFEGDKLNLANNSI